VTPAGNDPPVLTLAKAALPGLLSRSPSFRLMRPVLS